MRNKYLLFLNYPVYKTQLPQHIADTTSDVWNANLQEVLVCYHKLDTKHFNDSMRDKVPTQSQLRL